MRAGIGDLSCAKLSADDDGVFWKLVLTQTFRDVVAVFRPERAVIHQPKNGAIAGTGAAMGMSGGTWQAARAVTAQGGFRKRGFLFQFTQSLGARLGRERGIDELSDRFGRAANTAGSTAGWIRHVPEATKKARQLEFPTGSLGRG